jgi:hypothetical protein
LEIVPEVAAGKPCGWFAPNYKYLAEIWEQLIRDLEPITKSCRRSEYRIETTTGGVLDGWSVGNNPDGGRSRKYALAVIDEAAKINCLEKSWNEAIRPTLADLRGRALFLSTPKGQNFFARAFDRGGDPDAKVWRPNPEWRGWRSFRAPTASNPYIALSEIEAMRRDMPERVFLQEVMAIFLDDAGGVFKNVSACVDPTRYENIPYNKCLGYVAGVDLARINDYTVIVVLDRHGRQVAFYRINQSGWAAQINLIHEVSKEYRCPVMLDATGLGDPIFEALSGRGVDVYPFVISSATKVPLIDSLALAFERKAITLMDEDIQTTELLAYEYQSTGRNVKMGAPEGSHDDCVIALALAWHGLAGSGPLLVYA